MMVHGPNRANRQQLTGDRHQKSIIFLRPARFEPGLTSCCGDLPQIEKDDRSDVSARSLFSRSRASVSCSLEQPPKEKARSKKLLLANPITFGDKAAGNGNGFRQNNSDRRG